MDNDKIKPKSKEETFRDVCYEYMRNQRLRLEGFYIPMNEGINGRLYE